MPLFSVIIPVYNRADLVAKTLESLYAQRFTDFEIIAVNDGSKDNSLEVLRGHEGRIRVLTQENKGLGATRNTGFRASSGRYIVPLDSDDLYLPWSLETYAAAIEKHDEPSLLTAAFESFADEAAVHRIRETALATRSWADYLASAGGGGPIAPSAAVIRRDVYERAGGFTELRVNCEDADMWLKVGDSKGYVRIDEPVCLALRRGHVSMVSNFDHTLKGFAHIAAQEKRGAYGGGAARRFERRALIAAHLRSVCMGALAVNNRRAAWTAYQRSLAWNFASGRLGFMLAAPPMIAAPRLARAYVARRGGSEAG